MIEVETDSMRQRLEALEAEVRSSRRRQKALQTLLDRMRKLEHPHAVMRATAEVVGQHLAANRVGFFQMLDENTADFTASWTDGSLPSLLGTLDINTLGAGVAQEGRRGQTIVLHDTHTDSRTTGRSWDLDGTHASIGVPIIRDGRWLASFAVHQVHPRIWLPEEISFVEEIARLTWDMVQRAQAEVALQASELQFRTFAQAMPNHVWAARPDGQLDWFNDKVYKYSGLAPEEFDGGSWGRVIDGGLPSAALVHPADLPHTAQRWAVALLSGETYETEFRLRRADGAWRWHLGRALPIRGADGKIMRWIGTNTDIDDQRQAAQALAQMNETLERRVEERTRERDSAWKNSRDLQAVLDFEGHFLAVNEAWTTVLGWPSGDILGRFYHDFIHSDDMEAGREAFDSAKLTGLTPCEIRCLHQDGGCRWVSWVAASEAGRVYANGRHITAEKEAATILAATQDQLRQSQKMEAVGQLTGGLTHDFGNLLAGIVGHLTLVQKWLPTGRLEEIAHHVDAARDVAKRASALTHRLLAFARRQTLIPQPTNITPLVAGMEELVRATVSSAIEVVVVTAPGLWHALVDPNQLENALLNLCINARDAMPNGGRLTIEIANISLDDPAARQADLSPGHYLRLSVTDTGVGMTPEVIKRAFDPFFTTKPAGEGTGLGLSMLYGFARQSGGHAQIDSELGRGSTVSLYLPRCGQGVTP